VIAYEHYTSFVRQASLLVWSALLLAVLGFAATIKAAPATNAEPFLARIYTNATGAILPYRLLPPKSYNSTRSYPVILYLHGAAARGNDNAEPLNWGPRLFLDDKLRDRHDFFLVVPQCPRGGGWAGASGLGFGAAGESASLKLAVELLTNSLSKEFNLDAKRRYATGVSMGGHGVWVLLGRRPGFFAAGIPVCAPGEPSAVTDKAVKVPVWVFHSDDDHLVPVRQAREMVDVWRKQGGSAKYSEYTGLKHSSWKKAYTESEMFDWLFAQKSR